jgi:hypothetical protein
MILTPALFQSQNRILISPLSHIELSLSNLTMAKVFITKITECSASNTKPINGIAILIPSNNHSSFISRPKQNFDIFAQSHTTFFSLN